MRPKLKSQFINHVSERTQTGSVPQRGKVKGVAERTELVGMLLHCLRQLASGLMCGTDT